MSAQHYANALRETYRLEAAAIATAGVLGRVQGPAGKTGRVVNVSHIVTTDTTVAASVITVDTNAGLAVPVSHTVPLAPGVNTGGAVPAASLKGQTLLPADTVVEIQSDGGSTAGAADITVTIDWF